MKRPLIVRKDLQETRALEDLTGIFESIASIKIAKIRNRVVASKVFFSELWHTYEALRIDPKDRLKRTHATDKTRDVFVAITSEGKLGGAIDDQIIQTLLDAAARVENADVIVIGAHGQSIVRQRGVAMAQTFPMPASDLAFNVSDIIDQLASYRHISVFYQTYESLRIQRVAKIELVSAVRDLSEDVGEGVETVSRHDYIFEPGVEKIADYMESVMMGVALIQLIMESKLAQYATRFNNMSRAKRRADDLTKDYRRQYLRAKRSESDDRLKEAVVAVRYTRGVTA